MKVYKYLLPVADVANIQMPEGAQPLHVDTQDNVACLWALVDPDAPMEERRFRVAGTGHPIGEAVGRHVGSFKMHGGVLVFHVFEVLTHE